jgi:hypothetical protein
VLNKVKAEKRKRKSENHHTYNNRKKIKVVNRKLRDTKQMSSPPETKPQAGE